MSSSFSSFFLQIFFSLILPDLHHVLFSPPPPFFAVHRYFVPVPTHLRSRAGTKRHRSSFLFYFVESKMGKRERGFGFFDFEFGFEKKSGWEYDKCVRKWHLDLVVFTVCAIDFVYEWEDRIVGPTLSLFYHLARLICITF